MNIAIIGQGGHSKVIRDLILLDRKHQIIGYFDDKYQATTTNGNTFYGPISSIREMDRHFYDMKFMIGIGNNQIRKYTVQRLDLPDERYITLIHPSAVVSPSARIGHGTVIMAHSVINADTQISRHAIVNTGAVVEHDNQLADYVHVSPNATLTGAVMLEEGSHVGAGATVIPNIRVGEWATVGAGATVIHDVSSYCTAVGVPAKITKVVQKVRE